ncbi:hypothetical protein Q4551_12720 [Oceanobacter sp. 5_MG-2023]|uniref:hypothetical protein n=1 Tax=Oceanobacter sp. 5_MG-2023 TaxID=3062645 RepID=UPI0026E203F0|nr:hypothetical protein [Oceanobacter sp. 5_MG-2023]MDO6683152.1 hypothetical protein [Oceanobacter sp. 5_MG-2023]
MSHYISISSLNVQLMNLASLAIAGEDLCRRYMYKASLSMYDKEFYSKTLKLSVSESLIELAVKLRSFDDFCQFEPENDIDIYENKINKVSKNLRFICNKIIHADEVHLDYQGNINYNKDFTWWSGQITLSGKQGKNSWVLFFNVTQFCDSAIDFLYKMQQVIESKQTKANDLLQHS